MLLMLLPCLAFAADVAGNWCRSEGGRVVDVLKISGVSNGYRVSFHEGMAAPAYSEAFGQSSQGTLFLSARNVKTKDIIFIAATISGDRMTYRSYNLDGSFRWQGSFGRCAK